MHYAYTLPVTGSQFRSPLRIFGNAYTFLGNWANLQSEDLRPIFL